MKKARIIFAIIWSVISVLGIILWNFTPSHLVYFLFGFHTPNTTLVLLDMWAMYYNYPVLSLFMLLVLISFIILWIVAIVRINKSKLFLCLIFIDRLLSLMLLGGAATVIRNDFVGWTFLIGLFVENLIMIIIFFVCMIKKRKKLRRADCS